MKLGSADLKRDEVVGWSSARKSSAMFASRRGGKGGSAIGPRHRIFGAQIALAPDTVAASSATGRAAACAGRTRARARHRRHYPRTARPTASPRFFDLRAWSPAWHLKEADGCAWSLQGTRRHEPVIPERRLSFRRWRRRAARPKRRIVHRPSYQRASERRGDAVTHESWPVWPSPMGGRKAAPPAPACV